MIRSLALAASLLTAPPGARAQGIGAPAASLSVEAMAGQVFAVVIDTEIAGRYEALIRGGKLGGGMLRWDRFTAGELKAFTGRLQEWSAGSPDGIPFLVSVDHEGGPLFTQKTLGATIFPGNMALGAADSEDLAEAAAAQSARELRALGVHVDFAPAVDVNSNRKNPIIGVRSFGEDPRQAARFGAAAIRGYLKGGVLPAAKHFPGHGDTETDSHTGLPRIGKRLSRLEAVELLPFQAAIAAGVPMVMTAHISVPALGTGELPATFSRAVLEGWLRGRLGFHGVIVSDSLDMGAITRDQTPTEAAIRAFLAGCDLLLVGKADYPPVYEGFLQAVREGRIPRERLEASAGRILELKRRTAALGPQSPPEETDPEAGRLLARRIAEASVTLLRDEAGWVPLRLREEETLAVVLMPSPRFKAEAESFVRELVRRHPRTEAVILPPGPGAGDAERAEAAARKADVLVVGSYLWGGEPPRAQRELVRSLLKLERRAVLISLMNPYDVPLYPGAGTVVLAYGPTEAALGAAARLLFGEIRPQGRLPVTLSWRLRSGRGIRR